MRFAYADPPYPGLAGYYAEHPDFAGEVDHRALIVELEAGGFDGWAMSTSSRSLGYVLGLCGELGVDVRVAAWVRGPRNRRRARRPLQAWEPVLYRGGRELGEVRVDALVYSSRPRRTDPARVIGAKPARFARFVFELLGAEPGDDLVDLFPGSGGIGRAWAVYTSAAAHRDTSPEASPDASRSTSSDASPSSTSDASVVAVALVDTSRCCPTCAAPLATFSWGQPALFYFGGYGATTLRVMRRCAGCGWELLAAERSLNPRRDSLEVVA